MHRKVAPKCSLLHEKKEEVEKKKAEKQEKFSRTVITLENLGYLRQWESARYSKSSKSSTSRGCVVVVERRRWEPSALPWRGEAKEEQKGAAHGEKAYVVGDGRGRRWWKTKRAVSEWWKDGERGESRDTITSCTRRARSHFQTLLHEAPAPFLDFRTGKVSFYVGNTPPFPTKPSPWRTWELFGTCSRR